MFITAAIATIGILNADRPVSVEEKLRSLLASTKGVKFTHNADTLIVKFRTHQVKVPRPSKSRSPRLEEFIPSEQPTDTGFQLEVYEFPHAQGQPPRLMQAVRMNKNWVRDYGSYKMDAADRQIGRTDTARYYHFEWGNKLDTTLLSKIREALTQGTYPL